MYLTPLDVHCTLYCGVHCTVYNTLLVAQVVVTGVYKLVTFDDAYEDYLKAEIQTPVY